MNVALTNLSRGMRAFSVIRQIPLIHILGMSLAQNERTRQPSAGEAGVHAGESPAGRIRRFSAERTIREESVRPTLQAGWFLNWQAITKV